MRQYDFSNRYRRRALGSALFLSLGVAASAGTSCGPGVIAPIGTTAGDGGGGSSGGMTVCGGGTDSFSQPYTPDPAVAMQAKSIVSSLQLTQQATLMRGTVSGCPGAPQTGDIFRTLGIKDIIEGWKFRDGPRGVVLAPGLLQGQKGYSTAFPVASGRGATFDMALEEKIGEAMGDEMVASGHSMLLAPVINILRHPAWGRAQETYGEDSFLLGRLGTAFVIGVQKYVAACAKHFAANNIENGRASSTSLMDEQTLHEVYGRHFEMVIQDAGVACIMAAYNFLQTTGPGSPSGTQASHCTLDHELLTDMLRGTFGFKGFVLSDWWAVPGGTASCGNPANIQAVQQTNAAAAVNAGLDMELPWDFNFSQLETDVMGMQLTQQQVIQAGTNIVTQQLRFKVDKAPIMGLHPPPTDTVLNPNTGSIEKNAGHIALAHQAAIESMVLLKNDKSNGMPTLPIPATAKTIAVIGASVPFRLTNTDILTGNINFAKDVRLGDLGSSRVYSDPATSTGPFAGIQAAAGPGITVTTGSDAIAAMGADFIGVVAGLTYEDEGEEYTGAADRVSFSLDDKNIHSEHLMPTQDPLIASIAALNKPMVVVLEGGSVIDMPWYSTVPAVVMAWYPGQDGGAALGELLFGKTAGGSPTNFSGKLPVTWPNPATGTCDPASGANCFGDEPPFNPGGKVTMDYYLGYRYYDHKKVTPLFPFGHGLSYTTFKYENLQLPCTTAAGHNDIVNVKVDVTNTGMVDGDEVSFLFVSYPNTKAMRRSDKELKGFTRTTIKAQQKVTVTIPLRIQDLKYWDSANGKWAIESGAVQITVGESAALANSAPPGMLTIQ
jgi:beta-glucosidase